MQRGIFHQNHRGVRHSAPSLGRRTNNRMVELGTAPLKGLRTKMYLQREHHSNRRNSLNPQTNPLRQVLIGKGHRKINF